MTKDGMSFHGISNSYDDFGVCPYCHHDLPMTRIEKDVSDEFIMLTFHFFCASCNENVLQLMRFPAGAKGEKMADDLAKKLIALEEKPCPHRVVNPQSKKRKYRH